MSGKEIRAERLMATGWRGWLVVFTYLWVWFMCLMVTAIHVGRLVA